MDNNFLRIAYAAVKFICTGCIGIMFCVNTNAQDEVKGRRIIAKIDQISSQTTTLKQKPLLLDSISKKNLDTIINEATKFKMAIRRKNKYAELYEDDFSYYFDQLKSSAKFNNADSVAELINDIKNDIQFKTKNTFLPVDTGFGPEGAQADFSLVNFKVRVFAAEDTVPLSGFEIYIKRGIYLPSKDSMRIPELTNNAVKQLSPCNFTIVAWKGSQTGLAPIKVFRKPEVICDIKLK